MSFTENENLINELESHFKPFLKEEKITHVYAECGKLPPNSAAIRFSNNSFSLNGLSDNKITGNETVFDLASLTKAIVTAPLIFRETIKYPDLSIDHTVSDWLKQGSNSFESKLSPLILKLSIRSLLSHQSGLPAWRNFWINRLDTLSDGAPNLNDRQEKLIHIESILNRFSSQINPKKHFVYSDLGFILLGHILELRSGNSLDHDFSDFIEEDLQMKIKGKSSSFMEFPGIKFQKKNADKFVPTSFCKIRNRVLKGEVHDENCGSLYGVSGHAGLFSTGKDLSNYLSRLVAHEVGQKLLAENSSFIKLGNDPLCGWRQRSQSPLPYFLVGHLGFTGTAFWLNSDLDHYLILLTNRVISGRKSKWMQELRKGCYKIMQKRFLS